jgi:hypothetical protein
MCGDLTMHVHTIYCDLTNAYGHRIFRAPSLADHIGFGSAPLRTGAPEMISAIPELGTWNHFPA